MPATWRPSSRSPSTWYFLLLLSFRSGLVCEWWFLSKACAFVVFVDGFLVALQENIPLEEVFENLRCSRQGLSAQQAQQRLEIFGPNKLEEKEVLLYSLRSRSSSFRVNEMLKVRGFVFLMVAGEQVPQIFGLHVESTLMGHGGCRYHGHCARQRRGNQGGTQTHI